MREKTGRSNQYIGFDIGAESGRCVVGELKEEKIQLTEVYRFTTPFFHFNGHYYWDVLAICEEVRRGLVRAGERFGNRFDGISVDTWGVDYVLLDADDRLMGYPYHYRDGRTDGILEAAFRIMPKMELYKRTGIQFLPFNTLFQLLAEKRQKHNFLDHTAQLLMMSDFLLYFLSGRRIGEYTIVSTTNLADPLVRDWCWDVVAHFGLPRSIFPPVIEGGTVLGTLVPEIGRKTGIVPDTPVIAGASHDTGAAVAAVPALEEGWAYLSSGTWSLMGVELSRPLINREAMACNFTNEGGVAGTFRFLKNIIGLWPVQECRGFWTESGNELTYSQLTRMAETVGPVRAWIDVEDPRFLKPGGMPEKILAFLKETGQPHDEREGWIIRCVLESLAFQYQHTISELEKVTGHPIKRLHAVGGGIQNELLNQLTADAIGREVITGPVEGTIVGNIGMQAIATGAIDDVSHLRHIVAHSFEVKTYHPRDRGYFEANEERFRQIVKNKE